MRSKLAAKMKEMDTHRSKLNDAVNALGKDVQNYTLDAKQIAADSAAILEHLDELSKIHNGN
jgi:outer membrane murein-binding lipoprotein Lpp